MYAWHHPACWHSRGQVKHFEGGREGGREGGNRMMTWIIGNLYQESWYLELHALNYTISWVLHFSGISVLSHEVIHTHNTHIIYNIMHTVLYVQRTTSQIINFNFALWAIINFLNLKSLNNCFSSIYSVYTPHSRNMMTFIHSLASSN